MTVIRFRLRDGGAIDIEAANGETLMRTARANAVPGIIGECGGEMSCGTCHVVVESSGELPPPSRDELDLLESLDDAEECSRLGCQIRVAPELDGAQFRVVGET